MAEKLFNADVKLQYSPLTSHRFVPDITEENNVTNLLSWLVSRRGISMSATGHT